MPAGLRGCAVLRNVLRLPRRRGARGVCHAAVLLGVGCTEFESGTDELTPEMVTQQQQPQPLVGQDWTCLGSVAPPPMLLATPSGERLVQSVRFVDLATGDVATNISVRACAQRDVDCLEPLTGLLPLDADGWVDVPLFEGFDGFLEITGETVIPTLLFYAAPLSPGTEVDRTPLGLVQREILPALSGATGTQQDPRSGLVVLRSFDCSGDPAPGVSFDIDKAGFPWYFVGGLPSSTATFTAGESGLGGFINVAPGIAVVNAVLPGSALPIATPRSVLVRGGWMTAMRFVPQSE